MRCELGDQTETFRIVILGGSLTSVLTKAEAKFTILRLDNTKSIWFVKKRWRWLVLPEVPSVYPCIMITQKYEMRTEAVALWQPELFQRCSWAFLLLPFFFYFIILELSSWAFLQSCNQNSFHALANSAIWCHLIFLALQCCFYCWRSTLCHSLGAKKKTCNKSCHSNLVRKWLAL